MNLSEYLVSYRKERGMSQADFARQCNVTRAYMSYLEKGVDPRTGEKITPKLETLEKLASGMGLTVNELLGAVNDIPGATGSAEDDELREYLTILRQRPEMKMLFDASTWASKEQIEIFVRMIEGFKK